MLDLILKNAARLNIQKRERNIPANFVIPEAKNAVETRRMIAQHLISFKNGKQTFSNEKAKIYFNQ